MPSVTSRYARISALGPEDSRGLARCLAFQGLSDALGTVRNQGAVCPLSPHFCSPTAGAAGCGRLSSTQKSSRGPCFLSWRALHHFLLLTHRLSFIQRARTLLQKPSLPPDGTQSGVPGPAAPASCGHLLDMNISPSSPDPLTTNPGAGAQ